MRVRDIRVELSGRHCELHANVQCDTHWVWGKNPFPLWYRFPAEYADYVREDNGDPFFAAMLAPAMLLGETLEIDTPVSLKLLTSADEIQTIYCCWEPRLQKVNVSAVPRYENCASAGQEHHALFFSMGVDSSYSLWKNTAENVRGPEISHLVLVEGYDIYLWENHRFPPLLERVQNVADHFGKTVLVVTTNLREFGDRTVDWVRLHHGAALASIVLLFDNYFLTARIAASQTYRELIPRGAHPLLDPLWNTETVSFKHDGLEASRLEKIRCLAASRILVENLRICATSELTDAYNCGRCEKCLRTMIALHIAGALSDCRTLPQSIDADLVRNLQATNRVARKTLVELVEALSDSPADSAIRTALRDLLAQSPKTIQ